MLADHRVTICPSSTSVLSDSVLGESTILEEDPGFSTPNTSPTQPPAGHQASPAAGSASPQRRVFIEDENLNVKHAEEDIDATESDKEKLTKEHNEKDKLSPPPEELQNFDVDEKIVTDSDVQLPVVEKSMDSPTSRVSVDVNPAGNVRQGSGVESSTDGEVTLEDSSETERTGVCEEAVAGVGEITVDIRAPWEKEAQSLEGSALREALSLIDNLDSDSDTDDDSDSDDEVIVCDLSDNKASIEVCGNDQEKLPGEFDRITWTIPAGTLSQGLVPEMRWFTLCNFFFQH